MGILLMITFLEEISADRYVAASDFQKAPSI